MKNYSSSFRVALWGLLLQCCAFASGQAFAQSAAGFPKMEFCGYSALARLYRPSQDIWVSWGAQTRTDRLAGLTEASYLDGLSSGFGTPRRLKMLSSAFTVNGAAAPVPVDIFCSPNGNSGFAVLSNNALVSWGENGSGQLGTGNTSDRTTPGSVLLVDNVVDVSASTTHTLARTSDGRVFAWGSNTYGQVGDGTAANTRAAPSLISGLNGVRSVHAGNEFSVAVLTDGSLRVWGRNNSGQLGIGNKINQSVPVIVPNLSGVTDLALGASSVLARRIDGTVWAWGDNAYGVLGNGVSTDSISPVRIAGLENIIQVIANRSQTAFALDTSGAVWGWGRNLATNTLLGSERSACNNLCIPKKISGLPNDVVKIFMSSETAYAATFDGKLYSWGQNGNEEMGLGLSNAYGSEYAVPKLVHQSFAASDFDGDYSSDILFRRSDTGEIAIWNMASAQLTSSASVGVVGAEWNVVGIADADGDGRNDLFWRNSVNGQNAIWNLRNREVKSYITLPQVADLSWRVVTVKDVNGDGRADIVWRNNPSNMWAIWLMGENGVLDSRAYAIPGDWDIAAVADFKGGGKASILWRQSTTGALAMYQLDGLTVSGVTFLVGGLAEWDVVGVADISRNNHPDIILRLRSGALLARITLDANAEYIGKYSCNGFLNGCDDIYYSWAPGGAWNISAIGDYDADIRPDFLWRSSEGTLAITRAASWVRPGNLVSVPTVTILGNVDSNWTVIGK